MRQLKRTTTRTQGLEAGQHNECSAKSDADTLMVASTRASAKVKLADRVLGAPTGIKLFQRLKEALYRILRMVQRSSKLSVYIGEDEQREVSNTRNS